MSKYKLLSLFNLKSNISQIFILTRLLLEELATLNLVFQGIKFIFCVAWTYFALIFTFSVNLLKLPFYLYLKHISVKLADLSVTSLVMKIRALLIYSLTFAVF